MFEELSRRQLQQLETVWNTALKSVHWRETLRNEISRALATGGTLDHVAAATGFDQTTIERLRYEPRQDFTAGTPPTATHPAKSSSTRQPLPSGSASRHRRWFVGSLRLLHLGANAASNQVVRNESDDDYDHGYADGGDS
jgi:hypothetical protein